MQGHPSSRGPVVCLDHRSWPHWRVRLPPPWCWSLSSISPTASQSRRRPSLWRITRFKQTTQVAMGASSIFFLWYDSPTHRAARAWGSMALATLRSSAQVSHRQSVSIMMIMMMMIYLEREGIAQGTCAGGFGVCCTFSTKCGGTTLENSTYLTTDLTSSVCR